MKIKHIQVRENPLLPISPTINNKTTSLSQRKLCLDVALNIAEFIDGTDTTKQPLMKWIKQCYLNSNLDVVSNGEIYNNL